MTVQITPFDVFDARKGFDIAFRTTGNQTVRHTLTVYNNISGVKVYTSEVTSYKQAHTIPAGKLTNGTEYYCIIVVYDGNGESAESAPVQFRCMTTPEWRLNIANNEIVKSTAVLLGVKYEQAEGDPIDHFVLSVYTAAEALIFTSGNLYSESDVLRVQLDNNTSYYARAVGTTVAGFILDTGNIFFTTRADALTVSAVFDLLANRDEASITVASNIIAINGYSPSGEVNYVTHGDDQCVRSDSDNLIVYDQGFQMNDDYIIDTLMYLTELPCEVMRLNGFATTVTVRILYGTYNTAGADETGAFLEMRATGGLCDTVMYTPCLAATAGDKIRFMIIRQDGRYDIVLEGGKAG